jgi:hypothetical protein
LNQQLATAATYTPGSSQLLEVRFGVSRTRAGKEPPGLGGPSMASLYGIAGLPDDPRISGGLTAQLVTGFSDFGRQPTNPQWQHPTVWNPKANYSLLLGRHSLKTGYEYQRIHTEIQDVNPLYGRDTYAGSFSRPAGFTGGDAATFNLADLMFGLRNSYQLTNFFIAQYRQNLQFLYLQDDWKVSNKLTLNLGVRYEYATPQWEKDNLLTNFDPAGLTMLQAKSGSIYDRALIDPDRNNWAPRIGLAYSFNPRTVVRSGFGVNYIHFHRAGGGNILAINGPQVVTAVVTQQPSEATFRTTQQGYPEGMTSPDRFNPLFANITYMPRDSRTSYVSNWFFSVQREVMRNTLIDVAYVGNRANKLLLFADYNQAFPNRAGENVPLQARRPIQSFSDITYAFPGGWSNYNALQLRFERRYMAGLYLLNSFTWSKALDNGAGALEGPNGNASAPQDLRNLASEKGPSAYDQTLTNVTSAVWEFPLGRGRRYLSDLPGIAEQILGGWQISVINNMWSGQPLNLFYNAGGAFAVSGIGPDWRGAPRTRPNVTGDPLVPEDRRTFSNYLNRDTVSVPTDVSQPFGNAGRNIVRGPAFYQVDFALGKQFVLPREGMYLQFRTEVFNLLNKTNFNPTSNGNFTNRSNASFGSMTGTYDPRQIQFALKFVF